jgi:uncharacterized protein
MKINIQSLKNGLFELSDKVDLSDVELSTDSVSFFEPLDIVVKGEKNNLDYRIDVLFDGRVKFPCDRCSSEFETKISDEFTVIYTKSGQEDEEGELDIVSISNDAKEIDISNELIESVVLSFPMKRLHDENCKGVCECGANLNSEACLCEEKIDPRWEALAKLKKK